VTNNLTTARFIKVAHYPPEHLDEYALTTNSMVICILQSRGVTKCAFLNIVGTKIPVIKGSADPHVEVRGASVPYCATAFYTEAATARLAQLFNTPGLRVISTYGKRPEDAV